MSFPGPPNSYDFGTEFNYALWTPGTQVSLVNVPWNNDYRDVVRFGTPQNIQTLDQYIDERSLSGIQVEQVSYVKPGEPVRLDIPLTRSQQFNYLRVSNPLQPIPGDQQKNYYYFILDTRYIGPQTTEFILQLDIFQTYVYNTQFGNCYVERGHIAIANENAFNNYGRDYLTVPEGIDLGNEYRTVKVANKWVMTLTPEAIGERYPGFDVLVVSTTDLLADPGTEADPNLISAEGTTFQGTLQGAAFYIFSPQQLEAYLNSMQNFPWVTQGIVSITMIPRFARYHPSFDYSELVAFGAKADTLYPRNLKHDLAPNWRNTIEDLIPERYRHLDKLKTFPYMVIEMTTFNATPVILKPEAWNNADARVLERATLVPPGQRIEFAPRFYNSLTSSESELDDLYPGPVTGYEGMKGDDEGEYIDLVTQIANFPTMSIVNNGQIAYLAANTHGIAFQRQSADWTQMRALSMATGDYNVQSGAIQTAKDLSEIAKIAVMGNNAIGNSAIGQQANVDMIASAIGGAAGGAAFGGKGGAGRGAVAGVAVGTMQGVAGSINAGIQMAANDQSAAMRQNTISADTAISNRQAQNARDTNFDLAKFASRGDYANALAGINAKVQDAALIQPTTSGQMGGETVNMVNGGWQINLRWKMIDNAAMRVMGEYWLRYGYATRAFIRMPATLMAMTKFTYWKLTETYLINATIPESHKQGLRGIFEKGVTVWANPDDIGQIDMADNTPLGGISY